MSGNDYLHNGVTKVKRLYLPITLMLMLAITAGNIGGCQTLGVPKAETFNQKETIAISTVTGIRNLAGTLLQTGKITVADAKNAQEQADNGRAAIQIADDVHATNPQAGEDRLAAAVIALNAINDYLTKRK